MLDGKLDILFGHVAKTGGIRSVFDHGRHKIVLLLVFVLGFCLLQVIVVLLLLLVLAVKRSIGKEFPTPAVTNLFHDLFGIKERVFESNDEPWPRRSPILLFGISIGIGIEIEIIGFVPCVPVMNERWPGGSNGRVGTHPDRNRIFAFSCQFREAFFVKVVGDQIGAVVLRIVLPPNSVSLLAHALHPVKRIPDQDEGQDLVVVNGIGWVYRVIVLIVCCFVLGPRHHAQHAIDVAGKDALSLAHDKILAGGMIFHHAVFLQGNPKGGCSGIEIPRHPQKSLPGRNIFSKVGTALQSENDRPVNGILGTNAAACGAMLFIVIKTGNRRPQRQSKDIPGIHHLNARIL